MAQRDENPAGVHLPLDPVPGHSSRGRLERVLTPGIGSAAPSGPVYRRVLNEGPMDGFGYSWFDDRLARAGLARPRLLAREPDGEGAGFGYDGTFRRPS